MGSCLSSDSRDTVPTSPSGSNRIKKKRNARKKMGRGCSLDHKREDLLHRIPGRLFLNGSSDTACLFTQQGKKGTNQDAMLVWENFASRSDTVFCGVFDGHGPYGHMVAKTVRDSLPLKLSSHFNTNVIGSDVLKQFCLKTNEAEDASSFVNANEPVAAVAAEEVNTAEIFQSFKESFLKAFRLMDRELLSHASIDCFCSGTTAVTLIKQGKNLMIGNVGDSRAVLGTRDKDDTLTAVQLTVDLKPNLPAEEARIRKCKGRVFSLQDEPDVARVWLPDTDAPGLAMARAFGDFCLKDFGLISVPEISNRTLTEKDEFVVLASDGIWDVLPNQEVVNIVASAPRSRAARTLVQTAVRAWRTKYPTSKVDDCAVVCLFFDPASNSIVSSASSNTEFKEQPVSISQIPQSGLEQSDTVHSGNHETNTEGDQENSPSPKEPVPSESEIDWSALEGVSRVNTLLNLPRFDPGDTDRRAL